MPFDNADTSCFWLLFFIVVLLVCTVLHSYALQRRCHIYIPFLGIARPQPQFPHSSVFERYAGRSWEYINRSQAHECGNWDCGRAISNLGIFIPLLRIFVSNFRYCLCLCGYVVLLTLAIILSGTGFWFAGNSIILVLVNSDGTCRFSAGTVLYSTCCCSAGDSSKYCLWRGVVRLQHLILFCCKWAVYTVSTRSFFFLHLLLFLYF